MSVCGVCLFAIIYDSISIKYTNNRDRRTLTVACKCWWYGFNQAGICDWNRWLCFATMRNFTLEMVYLVASVAKEVAVTGTCPRSLQNSTLGTTERNSRPTVSDPCVPWTSIQKSNRKIRKAGNVRNQPFHVKLKNNFTELFLCANDNVKNCNSRYRVLD